MRRRIMILSCVVTMPLASWLFAQQTERPPRSPMKRYSAAALQSAYEARTFQGMPYRLLVPAYQETEPKKYPLILSLHGAGGRGDDNRRNLKVWNGVLMEPEFQKKHPCFVVVPQSTTAWRVPGSVPELGDEQIAAFPAGWQKFIRGRKGVSREDPAAVLGKVFLLLDELAEKKYPVDTDRVYVLGHSMGGMGSFEAIAMQPERFAAAIPSAGGLAPWHDVEQLKNVPIWAFHGDQDKTVPTELSTTVFEQLRKLGGNMKLTTLGGVGHGANAFAFVYEGDRMSDGFRTRYTSDRCDRTENIWEWLFRQDKKQR